MDGGTPTEFVGRIDHETEKAVLFTDSATARSLMKLAHRIDHLEDDIEDVDDDDRQDWLENRLQTVRNRFEHRDDVPDTRRGMAPEKPNPARCQPPLTANRIKTSVP